MKWLLHLALTAWTVSAANDPFPDIVPSIQSPHGAQAHLSAVNVTRVPNDNEVAIAVMGATGSGKSTFINLVSGSNLRVGRGLQSCTNTIQTSVPFDLDDRKVVLIDTPGFDDTTKSDADILKMIAAFLASTYKDGHKLSGVVYIHRISDFRMGGISTRNFKMFRQLCGDSTLKNVAIVSNMWSEVGREVGEAREKELATEEMFFKPALDNQARLLRHYNTVESAQAILRTLVDNHPEALRIQHELVDEHKNIDDTDAGAELKRDLLEQAKKHREELLALQRETEVAIRDMDDKTRKELELERQKREAALAKVEDEARKLAASYNDQIANLEMRLRAAQTRSPGLFGAIGQVVDGLLGIH